MSKECQACEGAGKIPCDACKGTGSMWIMIRPLGREEDSSSWELQDCTQCLAEREVKCPECEGTGKLSMAKRKPA